MAGDSATLTVTLTALAGCLGWGIRGVFGHQAGAMVPGALMGGAVALTCLPRDGVAPPHAVLLLMAVGAAGISVGGVMTYGQTLGLVHGERRPTTYWWGLLGCFVKGGLWFALGAVLLGLALAGELGRPLDVLRLAFWALLFAQAGRRLLNRPLRPPFLYPVVYFSRRVAEHEDISLGPPRQESWGGLLGALLAICVFSWLTLGAPQVWPAAAVGFLAGGLGFSVGEALQAWGIWRKPFGPLAQPWLDWWKVMEMAFGLIAGAGLGLAMLLVRPAAQWLDPWPGGYGPLAAVIGMAWLALVVGNAWGNRTASRLNDMPLLSAGLLLTATSAAPRLAPALVVGGFLLYISGADVLKRLRGQVSAAGLTATHVALALLAVGGAAMVAVVLPPEAVLVSVALSQTILAFAKALVEAGPGPLGGRLRRLRAAIGVETSFVVLTALLWALS